MKIHIFIPLFLLGLFATKIIAAPPSYTITLLGEFGGQAINDSGQTVRGTATSSIGEEVHLFVDESDGSSTELGSLPFLNFQNSRATLIGKAINNAGQVVGYVNYFLGSPYPHLDRYNPFLYIPGNGLLDMASYGDAWRKSTPNDINDSGQVIGISHSPDGGLNRYPDGNHALLFTPGTGTVDLGPLGNVDVDIPIKINNSGQVVGTIIDDNYVSTCFHYIPGVGSSPLNSLAGYASTGSDINDSGQIVGTILDPSVSPYPQAFIYTPGSGRTYLGTIGEYGSYPYSINNSGQVVGRYYGSSSSGSFLYTQGVMYKLDELIANFGGIGLIGVAAESINNKGQIVGYAFSAQGGTLGFIATPVQQKWITPAGGQFGQGANWSTNSTPDSSSNLLFDLPGSYTVAFSGDAASHDIKLSNGDVTFGLGSSVLDLQNLTIANSTLQLAQGQLNVANNIVTNSGWLHLNNANVAAQAVLIAQGALLSGSGSIAADVQLGGHLGPYLQGDSLQISGKFLAAAGSETTVGALLRVGDGSTDAFNAKGHIQITTGGVLEIQSADGAELGGTVAMNAGIIRARSDTLGTVAKLRITGSFSGSGHIDGRIQTESGSLVTATGPLTIGSSDIKGDGVTVAGDLAVGSQAVTLENYVNIGIYGSTTISGGLLKLVRQNSFGLGAQAFSLGSTGHLEGFGEIEASAGISGELGSQLIVSGGELKVGGCFLKGTTKLMAGGRMKIQNSSSNLSILFGDLILNGGSMSFSSPSGYTVSGNLQGHGDMRDTGEMTAADTSTITPTGILYLDRLYLYGTSTVNVGSQLSTILTQIAPRGILRMQGGTYKSNVAISFTGLYLDRGTLQGFGLVDAKVQLESSALIVTQNETLTVTDQIGGTGSHIILQNGTLNAQAGIDLSGGSSLSGNGTIIGNVAINGVIKPGESPGKITVNGNLTLGTAGTLVMEMAGTGATQKDLLAVHGNLNMGGRLMLSFTNGFAPKTGDQFALMTADGTTLGAFTEQVIEGLAPGFQYNLGIQAGVLTMTALNDGISIPTYATWGSSLGLTGDDALPQADPDHDGISNLAEYAFNLSPQQPGVATLVPGTGTSGLPSIQTVGSGPTSHLKVEFLRRKNAGAFYSVEFSSDLASGSWQPATAAAVSTSIDEFWERVVVEDSSTVSSSPRRFGRVALEKP